MNYWTNPDHALKYLARADSIPHRTEGEAALLAELPLSARRILDLGAGDGRLSALVRIERPQSKVNVHGQIYGLWLPLRGYN